MEETRILVVDDEKRDSRSFGTVLNQRRISGKKSL